ncbi:MFS transporter [Actinoplanes sp. LDG1-06]|uniref:MFS transporter n=1 Tax=Paractinoplanes ovalisporus TaxID=2810368 RepID=A0ABS2ASK7_9ACTN|nr:MFS transporter [Actinoplanes ovalisporus]MBM2622713.1 MFS transporter [Actinoplanes ovalisporus]
MTVAPRTSLGRLIPALLVSQVGFYVALLTPVQLLLTLRLTDIAGDDATSAFGVVTGFGALVALVFNPIAGRISDRTVWLFGRRHTWILTGALAGAAALVALGAATAVWQVVVLWCFVQALFNFQYAATNALVADQVPAERRGGVSGLVGLTIALGPLSGLALANSFDAGSSLQWTAVAVVAAIAGVVAVVLLRDTPASRTVAQSGGSFLRTFWINPRRHPAFGWAWLVRFLITCAYASSSYNAFFLLQRFDVSEDEVGATVLQLSLISVVLLAVTSVAAGYLSDAVRRQKPFIVFAGVIAAAALVMMAFAPSLTVVYLATGLLGIGTGAFFAIDLAMCVRVLPSTEDAGKDLAIINIANSLPQSVVPFVAPLLLAIGGYSALFGFLAVLGLLGAASVLRVPEIGQENDENGRTAPITRHDLVHKTASDERTLA